MTDLKSNLEKNLADSFNSSDGIEKISKEASQDIVEGDFHKSRKTSMSEKPGSSSDPAGKKRFPNFVRMVNGLRSNKKERTDTEKSTEIGDTQKANKSLGKNNNSTISRMWNSLFPNKESPDVVKPSSVDELHTSENRSTKTLGRMFSPRTTTTKNFDKNNSDEISRPKSSTLGRKITQSFKQFKMAETPSNVAEDIQKPITTPTTSLDHGNITPTPV